MYPSIGPLGVVGADHFTEIFPPSVVFQYNPTGFEGAGIIKSGHVVFESNSSAFQGYDPNRLTVDVGLGSQKPGRLTGVDVFTSAVLDHDPGLGERRQVPDSDFGIFRELYVEMLPFYLDRVILDDRI